jgi:diacylglycerol kinase family enzyme
MLHRTDKKKIPVAFIPNGTGNDASRALSIYDVNQALDYIVKGDVIKFDLTRVLLDHEYPPEDTNSKEYISHYRYQIINSSFNVPAKINHRAMQWKWCC